MIGARPQFIKASVVSNCIGNRPEINEVIVHTGQHFDRNMSDIFFSELCMKPPKYNLNIGGGDHGSMTGRMLIELEKILIQERPNVVLVYGDTNSTLAGALAAVKLHLPIAHVESGLRSFNKAMPEEVNRIITDKISDLLFTPTVDASKNLILEGAPQKNIFMVGDVMYDAALLYGEVAQSRLEFLKRNSLKSKNYILVTIHRAENTNHLNRLQIIVDALNLLAGSMTILWPMHPRTRIALSSGGLINKISSNIKVIDPVGYIDMVMLEKNASLIVTDSGGVQKEAFFHKVPCVTLRDETEWTELIDAGWNRLAPPLDVNTLVSTMYSAIGTRGLSFEPYGNGAASQKIIDAIQKGV